MDGETFKKPPIWIFFFSSLLFALKSILCKCLKNKFSGPTRRGAQQRKRTTSFAASTQSSFRFKDIQYDET